MHVLLLVIASHTFSSIRCLCLSLPPDCPSSVSLSSQSHKQQINLPPNIQHTDQSSLTACERMLSTAQPVRHTDAMADIQTHRQCIIQTLSVCLQSTDIRCQTYIHSVKTYRLPTHKPTDTFTMRHTRSYRCETYSRHVHNANASYYSHDQDTTSCTHDFVLISPVPHFPYHHSYLGHHSY